MGLETGVLHIGGVDTFTLGSHCSITKIWKVQSMFLLKGVNARLSASMYMMMLLRGVHVTKGWSTRIFPKIVQTLVDTLEIHNRDRQSHTYTETKISCVVIRKMQKVEMQKETQRSQEIQVNGGRGTARNRDRDAMKE